MSGPDYQFHVFCCTNQRDNDKRPSCGKAGEDIQKYMKVRAKELGVPATRINKSGCLDQCECGPVVVIYPEGVWYRVPDKAAAERVLQEHLLHGHPVRELLLPAQPDSQPMKI